MFNEELPDHVVYSPPVIDFVTVVAETCLFLENASEGGRDEFIDKSVKILRHFSSKLKALNQMAISSSSPTNSKRQKTLAQSFD